MKVIKEEALFESTIIFRVMFSIHISGQKSLFHVVFLFMVKIKNSSPVRGDRNQSSQLTVLCVYHCKTSPCRAGSKVHHCGQLFLTFLVTRACRLNVSNPEKVLLFLTPSHKPSTNFRTPSNYGQGFALIDVLYVPMQFSLAGQEIQSVSLFPIFK